MRIQPSCLLVSISVLTLLGCNGSDIVPLNPGVGGSGQGGSVTSSQGGAALGGAAPETGGNTPGTGGATSNTGGVVNATGGADNATGGANSRGGSVGVGGSTSKGGATSTGGSTATGGGPETGGVTSKGGSVGKGGVTAAGGTSATGGAKATGGGPAPGGAANSTGGVVNAGGGPTVPKFVGNITTGNSIDSGGMKYATYWNQITPENAGKWGSVQSSPSASFNWGTLDSIYNYANTNNILFKQHTFVWGAQQPSGTPTLAQVENWIKSFCTRYPKTALIDVVNEPPPHTTPNYTANLGAGETGSYPWITKAFKLARQHCPNAILILNDYNNIEWSSNQTTFNNIVKDIKAAGAPIDAVGAQAHDLDHASVSFATVKSLLASLNSGTGLPVYITEMDLDYSDDTAQLNAYKQFFPLFMDTDYVKGITIWGWIFGSTWSQAPNSGLVRSGKSRPAMTYIMGLLGRPSP